MRVIDPGHAYALDMLDTIDIPGADREQKLVFVKREGEGYPGNVGHHEGTNVQEVLRACIDRLSYLDEQIHDENTVFARRCLREAVHALEVRAALRHGRPHQMTVEEAVAGPTCPGCGHVGCQGDHRAGH